MKFIVVRFPPGGGGKFLCTCLQASPDVHAWETELEKAKITNTVLDYVKTKFTQNKIDWQKIEPEVPYEIQKFSSNRYPRGEDVTLEQALDYLKDDDTFQNHYNKNGKINLILNKTVVPKWLQNNSNFINIHLDNSNSIRWYRVARITKMFVREGNNYIIKQEHPAWLNAKRSENAVKFDNEKVYTGTWHGFVRKYVINEELGVMFQDVNKILQHKSNNNIFNYFFNLSNYGNSALFVARLNDICDKIGITRIDNTLLKNMLEYYQSLHT